jgi:hypothetical protein
MPHPPSHVMDDDEGITESLLTLSHYHVPEMQAPSIACVERRSELSTITSPEYLPLWPCWRCSMYPSNPLRVHPSTCKLDRPPLPISPYDLHMQQPSTVAKVPHWTKLFSTCAAMSSCMVSSTQHFPVSACEATRACFFRTIRTIMI